MKKASSALKIYLILAIFSFSFSAKSQPTKVDSVFSKALELNWDRFEDLNLIYPGDTVFFPSKTGPGVEAWIADWPENGRHYSIYMLSEKYVNEGNRFQTFPVDTTQFPIAAEVANQEPAKKVSLLLPILITIFAVSLIAIIAILIYRLIEARKQINYNPDNYPAVGGNIDEQSLNDTLRSIHNKYLKDGEKIMDFRTGTLQNEKGKKQEKVEMEFGDNQKRKVYIYAGERVSQVTISDEQGAQRTLYLRNACTNGFAAGYIVLNDEWYIDFDDDYQIEGNIATINDSESPAGWKYVKNDDKEEKVKEEIVGKAFESNLDKLVNLVTALNVNGSTIDIDYKETDEEIKLALHLKGQKKEKKQSKKS